MESFVNLFAPLIHLLITISVIVIIFLFLVKPFFNYLIINRQIEQRKKVNFEIHEAKIASRKKYDEDENVINAAVDHDKKSILKTKDQEAISKLADSNPDKAGELVKKWLHTD